MRCQNRSTKPAIPASDQGRNSDTDALHEHHGRKPAGDAGNHIQPEVPQTVEAIVTGIVKLDAPQIVAPTVVARDQDIDCGRIRQLIGKHVENGATDMGEHAEQRKRKARDNKMPRWQARSPSRSLPDLTACRIAQKPFRPVDPALPQQGRPGGGLTLTALSRIATATPLSATRRAIPWVSNAASSGCPMSASPPCSTH